MHTDCLSFYNIEHEVILHHEVTIAQSHQLFFVWDSAKLRVFCKQRDVLFYLCSQYFSSGRSVSGNIEQDFSQVFFGNAQKPDRILRLTHEGAFEGLS